MEQPNGTDEAYSCPALPSAEEIFHAAVAQFEATCDAQQPNEPHPFDLGSLRGTADWNTLDTHGTMAGLI
jgi:hypothetical protein